MHHIALLRYAVQSVAICHTRMHGLQTDHALVTPRRARADAIRLRSLASGSVSNMRAHATLPWTVHSLMLLSNSLSTARSGYVTAFPHTSPGSWRDSHDPISKGLTPPCAHSNVLVNNTQSHPGRITPTLAPRGSGIGGNTARSLARRAWVDTTCGSASRGLLTHQYSVPAPRDQPPKPSQRSLCRSETACWQAVSASAAD